MTWELIALTSSHLFEAWALRLILCLAIGLFFWRAAAWTRSAFQRATRKQNADPNVCLVPGRLVYGTDLALVLVWVLGILGVEQASMMDTFGALGLAMSLALQDILK